MTPTKFNAAEQQSSNNEGLVRILLFGSPKVYDHQGVAIPITSRKTLALLAILAANLDQPIARTKLAGMLWDQAEEPRAQKSLRQELFALSLLFPGKDSPIELAKHSIRLPRATVSTDLDDLKNGNALDPAHYCNSFMSDFGSLTETFDEWLLLEEHAQATAVLQWHENRLAALIASGASNEEQISAAREFLAFDVTHERAWRVVIEGLIELGDKGQASRAYTACETALRNLLDTPLSAETQLLKQRIFEEDLPKSPIEVIQTDVIQTTDLSLLDEAARQASIAILPILDLTEQPQARFLTTSLQEGIIHVLSGIGGLTVISRASAMKFVGKRVDPQEAGRSLGVRYLLTGSISGDNHRLYAFLELSEAEAGHLLWTERVPISTGDMYEAQEAIVDEIVAAIAPSVRANDLSKARRKPAASLTAYELLLQGLDNLYQLDRTKFDEAGKFLRRAVDLDPGFAAVRSHTATWHNFKVGQGWSAQPDHDLAQAATLSSEALALDHTDATALAIQGQILSYKRRDYDQARTYFDRAIRVGPSCHLAWTLSSTTYGWVGDGASAVTHAERAMRISPLDPFSFFTEHMMSQGYYVDGNYDKAIYWGRRAADRNGRLTSNLRTLSAALVAAGQVSEARDVVAQVRQIEPAFDLARFEARTPFVAEIRVPHIERLREAGF